MSGAQKYMSKGEERPDLVIMALGIDGRFNRVVRSA